MDATATHRPRVRNAAVAAGVVLALAAALGVGRVTAASHELTIINFEFEPATLTVLTGEPVTWTNSSTRNHTVTSDQGAELDGNPIQPGEAYGHVFETPGTFAYHCEIHPDMRGTITVQAAPAPSGSPEPTPPAGTLPPNFSPFPSTGPLETSPPPIASPTASAIPGSTTGGDSPQFLILAFIGVALVGVVAYILIRRARRTEP